MIKFLAIIPIVLLLLAGCEVPESVTELANPPPAGKPTWSTACTHRVLRSPKSLSLISPCKELSVTSYWIAPGNKHRFMPSKQVFDGIANGKVGDWSWKLSGTPDVVKKWKASSTTPVTMASAAARTESLEASWPRLFSKIYALYRYVLAKRPPPSRFAIYFFPRRISIGKRNRSVSTQNSIVMPLYFPYMPFVTPKVRRTHAPATETKNQHGVTLAYIRGLNTWVGYTACYEYMHALFLTGHLKKVLNTFSESVADATACTALIALIRRGSPHSTFEVASKRDAKRRGVFKYAWPLNGPELLREQNGIDRYAYLVSTYNIANLFGADTHSVTIRFNDYAKIMRLLKLARAMLQQPVDFMKQPLYPLDRLESVPNYAGPLPVVGAP